jgi:hypothetical protein
MKKTPDKKMYILFLTFILIFGITNANALAAGTGPFDVLLIGTFISPDEKGNAKTFELWTDEENWRFTVTKAHVMSRSSVSGWRLLSDIFPRKIKVFGDERVTAPLKQPELEGKNFKLRGRLYINAKRFHLNIVEEVMAEESPGEEKKE